MYCVYSRRSLLIPIHVLCVYSRRSLRIPIHVLCVLEAVFKNTHTCTVCTRGGLYEYPYMYCVYSRRSLRIPKHVHQSLNRNKKRYHKYSSKNCHNNRRVTHMILHMSVDAVGLGRNQKYRFSRNDAHSFSRRTFKSKYAYENIFLI